MPCIAGSGSGLALNLTSVASSCVSCVCVGVGPLDCSVKILVRIEMTTSAGGRRGVGIQSCSLTLLRAAK